MFHLNIFHKFKKPKIPFFVNYTYLHYQIGLSLLNQIGPIRAKEIVEQVPDLTCLFHWSKAEIHRKTSLRPKVIDQLQRKKALEKADSVIRYIKKNNITPIFYTDNNYPRRLKACNDSPIVLYQKGNLSLNDYNYVAIVGTRNATSYGKKICEELVRSLVETNTVVVSGLAKGIDATVHKFCLEYNVPTIGVLGHGLDIIYPTNNRKLAKEMEEKGALLTEFIPGTQPDRENFPKRNRIVAGMCDATIVVESKIPGGSLITAELAFDYNRDVFAFPGDIFQQSSKGCNKLIYEQKAHLIQSGDDFLKYMSWDTKEKPNSIQPKLFQELTDTQIKITNALKEEPLHVDVLASRIHLNASQLNAELFFLEMEGLVKGLPGKVYQLI